MAQHMRLRGRVIYKRRRAEIAAKLKEARDLLAQPYKWAKGGFEVRTGHGVAYCAVGALRQVAPHDGPTLIDCEVLLNECASERGHYSVVKFNDARGTRKKDVLEVFDCAIEKVKP